MSLDNQDMHNKVTSGVEKFSKSVGMIWGGISSRGLVPKDRPIFIEEFLWNTGDTTMDTIQHPRLFQ
jgi:hypothetical protein